ncbi:MAG: hypothetical protein JWO84_138 [Parcubacteria group bacterium]|nr:hypothetical protein [Parcubacteria group bacterium]
MSEFHDRIDQLAAQEGKTVGDHLKEEELRIEQLDTIDGTGAARTIPAPESAASRLFIESEARRIGGTPSYIDPTGEIAARACRFYGIDLWDDEPYTGKHPIIDALRSAQRINITWK